MLKYILIAIITISLLMNIWMDINAYKRKEYDPLSFRFKRDYEDNKAYWIAQFGVIISFYFLGSYFEASVYEIAFVGCIFVAWILSSHILKLLCYFRTKRKRILIELVISDLLLVAIIIGLAALIHFDSKKYFY